MAGLVMRLLPLLLCGQIAATGALAQQRTPDLRLGDAIVTGFSGVVTPVPGRPLPPNKSAIDLTFIDPEGASARVVDVSRPGVVWDGAVLPAPKPFDVLAKDVGQVFGIALDDAPQPNIYLASTSLFGLNIVARGRDGQPERRKKGGPGAGWMKGQFGLDLQGSPGAIYKIDGRTGAPTLFANVTLDGVPNPGPGLGNLAYDAARKQLFVSDLYTGMIHRFDLDGRELDRYDHGVTGLTAARLTPVAFDPRNRPNIGSDRFDSERPNTWGYAPPARRVWGLAVHQDRLYYSVTSGPQIWSIGIARDGRFANDPRWELDIPAQAGPLPVSDIAFSNKGAMILAQRALTAGAYDYSSFTQPGEPQVFRVWLKGPQDPPSPGRWKLVPEEYAVGFAGNHRNTNGGVALGYGYGRDGNLSGNACEFSLWTTGQNLRNAPALRARLDPGGPLVVHGLQGLPASPVREINTPPWLSYTVAYGDRADNPRAAGHLGSVRIYSKPCASPGLYSGPGYPANPPYTVVTVLPEDCIFGRRCSPPPDPQIDIGIAKIGERNVNNPDGPYNFTIGARNLAGPITTPQTITFTDVVPAGMTFTNVTSTNWNCSPIPGPPIPAGGTLMCTYSGTFPIATSQLLGTVSIVATGGDGPYENCATLPRGDGNAENDRACVTVQKPPLDVKLEKKLSGTMLPHFMFDIDVSNVGIPFVNGTFTVTDAVPAGMTVMSATGGWTCNTPVTGPAPMICTLPVASIPLNAALPTIKLTTIAPGPGPWENCAVVSVVTTSGTDTNPANDKGCATTAAPQVGELIIEKKVVYTGELMMPSLTYPVTVTCGTWNQTFNLVPNVPQSAGGVPLNVNCAVTETLPPPPASACPAPKVATWQTPPVVSPATPFQLSGVSTSVTVTNTLDCKVDPPSTVTFTVKKEVINRTDPLLSVTGLVYPISTSCQLGTSPAVITNMPLLDGGSQTITGITSGTTCTVTEGPPPPPIIIAAGCTTPGHVPVWTIVLPPPTTLTTSNATATVQNILDCKPGSDGQLGELVVTKTVLNKTNGQVSTAGLIYPFSVSCSSGGSPAVVTTFNLTENNSYTVSNIAPNSSCAITEPTMPTPTTGACSTSGSVPTWQTPPTITPASPVSVNGTSVPVTVLNTLECKSRNGYLLVQKIIDRPNNVPLNVINGLTFPVVVTCDGNATPLNVTFGTSAVLSNIPVDQQCSVVETLPPPPNAPNLCPAGQSLAWILPQTYTPPSVTITAGPGKTIVVRNTLGCAPTVPSGRLAITKTVVSVGGLPVAGVTFPATLNCSSGMSPAVVTPLTALSHGSTQTVSNIANGASCTVVETLPPPPTSGCSIEGQVPTWTTTSTPPTASIPADTSIAVVNTLECKKPGGQGGGGGGGDGGGGGGGVGSLVVTKNVTNNTTGTVSNTSYAVTVSCQLGSSSPVITQLTLVPNVPQTVEAISTGSNCTVTETETLLLPPGSNVCSGTGPGRPFPAWTTTVTPSPVPVNGPNTPVTVQNTLDCVPTMGNDARGHVIIRKVIQNDAGADLSGLTFPITLTCGTTAGTVTLTPTALSQTIFAIPVGAVCSAVEVLPPPPQANCFQGRPTIWVGSPHYSHANVTVVAGSGPTITVTNRLVCVPGSIAPPPPPPPPPPPLGCQAPMVPGPVPNQCICPQGTVQSGRDCVRRQTCQAPMIQGPIPGQCLCPAGTVQVGGSCVKQTACKAPLIAGPVPGQCVCPAGTTKRGERCITAVVCRSPATLNGSGTACTCPQGMTLKGNTCVKEDTKRPAITPNDVIRVVPGLIGPGGFGGGGRSGGGDRGGGSGPAGGGGGAGGGYKPPGVR